MAVEEMEELKSLFLFETLSDAQLGWLTTHGRIEKFAADDLVYREGEPGTCFVVLLDGTFALTRAVRGGGEVEVTRTGQRGSYAGAIRALFTPDEEPRYTNSLRALTDSRFFMIPVEDFGAKVREWFPLGMHLVSAVFHTMLDSTNAVSERERLVALGQLTAGLTHELNNPAAAASRATAALSERLAHMRTKLAALSAKKLPPDELFALVDLQNSAVMQTQTATRLSPMETSDREDEFTDWLEGHGIPRAVDMAAVLVAGGLDLAWADKVADAVSAESLPSAMAWLAYTVETETLLSEITDATSRISELLSSARQYSQMDRAPQQRVDIRNLLDATLAMMAHKIPAGVRVVKDYDPTLPQLDVYAAELNQVWTNVVDNALDAMAGSGTLTIRTRHDNGSALIEIGDSGPGIPPEIRDRIFEPFFSTKEVGRGTGLGLDISWRIVVKKHHGDIRVESRPGDTRFQIRLPV